VFNNFDFQDEVQTKYIKDLNNEISKLKYIQPPVYSWFASFNNYLSQGQSWTEVCGATNVDQYPYE
jgi:Niemann-Pick C1 protein